MSETINRLTKDSHLQLPADWSKAIDPFITDSQQLHQLFLNVTDKYSEESVLPDKSLVFNALDQTPYNDVKVVILGQDPYPTKGHAMGLSFSVPNGVKIARSLSNIYKERLSDLGIPMSTSGDLTPWTKQGVLLLNTVLTVKEGIANSHRKLGWHTLTTPIIQSLNNSKTPIVFVLWGAGAHEFKPFIDTEKHDIIECSHPSPLGATKTDQPFFGSRCFSRTNELLQQNGLTPIDWSNEPLN